MGSSLTDLLDLSARLAAARHTVQQRDEGGGHLPSKDRRPIATLRPGDQFRQGGTWHTIEDIDWRGQQCRVRTVDGVEFSIAHGVQVPFRWATA
jgi:hypothetical protein